MGVHAQLSLHWAIALYKQHAAFAIEENIVNKDASVGNFGLLANDTNELTRTYNPNVDGGITG